MSARRTAALVLAGALLAAAAAAQSRISGQVLVAATGDPAGGAEVTLRETGAATTTRSPQPGPASAHGAAFRWTAA